MRAFLQFSRIRGVYLALSALMVISSVGGVLAISKPAAAAVGTITQYTVPNTWSDKRPGHITVGPDNNIWYTNALYYSRVDKLTTTGTFTQYNPTLASGKYMQDIITGPDGNMWYAEVFRSGVNEGKGRIIKITTSGILLDAYSTPSGDTAIELTSGPDGDIWYRTGYGKVGKVSTAGVFTENIVGGGATDITTGPDGNLWVTIGATGSYSNYIVKLTTAGVRTNYLIPSYNAYPDTIIAGPDGNLWFTEHGTGKIGKITTAGVMTEYTLPTVNSGPKGIASGSDGNLWVAAGNTGKILRMNTSGTVLAEYSVPGASSYSLDYIVAGPDGAVWFTNGYAGKIGRIATELSNQTSSFTSIAPTNAVIDGPTYTPIASSTSGLPVTITVDALSTGICSISSGVVSFQQSGTCTLNANQSGDADYNPSPQIQQSFAVAPVNSDTSISLNCPTTAPVNSTVTCTITIQNQGPALAENATLTALFSSSFTGASVTGGGTITGQSISWTTPSIAVNDSVIFTFTATASAVSRSSLSASLLQTNPDSDISNNVSDSKILIQ